jgi:hypothetical protein
MHENLAAAKNADGVCQPADILQVVARIEDSRTPTANAVQYSFEKVIVDNWVETRCRFVQNKQFRSMGNCQEQT